MGNWEDNLNKVQVKKNTLLIREELPQEIFVWESRFLFSSRRTNQETLKQY